jgi:hypothetical protein
VDQTVAEPDSHDQPEDAPSGPRRSSHYHQISKANVWVAARPRTTGPSSLALPSHKLGGMVAVCDPVLATTSEQIRAADRCRRGEQVVLEAGYARQEGLRNCLGLVGTLERRAQTGVWNVIFPFVGLVLVSVGHESRYGLLYADTVPGLAAPPSSKRREHEYQVRSGLLQARVRECAHGTAAAGRKTGEHLLAMLAVLSAPSTTQAGWVEGRTRAGASHDAGKKRATAKDRAQPVRTHDEIAAEDERLQMEHDVAWHRVPDLIEEAVGGAWGAGDGSGGRDPGDLFAIERLLSRFFSYLDTSKLPNVPHLALRYQGQQGALRARLRAKYGADHFADTPDLIACKLAREKQALLRSLQRQGGGYGGGDKAREDLLRRVEAEGLFYEWAPGEGRRPALLQLVVSDKSGAPLMLLKASSKELVASADQREVFDATLADATPVLGVVEDGTPWVHDGAVYECVRGTKVMVRRGYAKGREGLLKGCLQNRDGTRVVGILESRVRMGEWRVRFPGEGPLVTLPAGVLGHYALQYVDSARWAARRCKYQAPARQKGQVAGAGEGGRYERGDESHPAPPHWPLKSTSVHCSGRAVTAPEHSPAFYLQEIIE